jgi:signal transduction histidine kinase
LPARNGWRAYLWPLASGFVLGGGLLHPVSMLVFHWLDPRLRMATQPGAEAMASNPIAHSFQLDMLPMALVFGGIGSAIAMAYSGVRLIVVAQRDELAERAAALQASHAELARLELANRRTTQYLAHDFKTSLGCIAGFAAQLLAQPGVQGDQAVRHGLAAIRRQASGMMAWVGDLLQFARLRETGALRTGPVSASHLLSDVVADFTLPAQARRISVGKQHRTCPSLVADASLLHRVLCNLTANALKHNGQKTRVRLDAVASDEVNEVRFSCCDDGAGISPSLKSTLFSAFTGTHDARTNSSGLGLAFCKAVVEAHGGRIWCESAPGRGASFFFTVPLERKNDAETT